jgi:TM2 domain-containing membrane protein YozV
MMFCRACGREIDELAELCPECGVTPTEGDKHCHSCGNETKPEAEFCVKCGAKLAKPTAQETPEAPAEPKEVPEETAAAAGVGEVLEQVAPVQGVGEVSQKSRLASTLLALFLGWLGIHRFYLGKTGTAVIMLVLGALGLATVWFGIGIVFLVAVWVWQLIDFVFAVAGLMKDKEGKPIKNW